jgi:hypothetical protein
LSFFLILSALFLSQTSFHFLIPRQNSHLSCDFQLSFLLLFYPILTLPKFFYLPPINTFTFLQLLLPVIYLVTEDIYPGTRHQLIPFSHRRSRNKSRWINDVIEQYQTASTLDILFQHQSNFLSKISQNQIRPCPLHTQQRLQNNLLLVDPAHLTRSPNH